jgi:hypothetical protein
MKFITPWFPFTIEEVAMAFEAGGFGHAEAQRAAASMALELADSSKEDPDGFGFTEVGNFLDPIAQLSEDAARRVAEFRRRHSLPPDWPGQSD